MTEQPRILILYYSQTGQLRNILDRLAEPMLEAAIVDFVSIEPAKPFPFPWKAFDFFDTMPETVKRLAIPMQPLPEWVWQHEYDLVILGYQPWFLNPSLPISSFLKDSEAARLLRGKPVVTVIGSRNMWLHAQEKIKEDLTVINAELVGNIALTDKSPNLVSTLTIIRWLFNGRKEASGFLPAAGIRDEDIRAVSRFAAPIITHLKERRLAQLQKNLLASGAIQLKPGLVLLERRGIRNFRKWADYIRAKGGPADPARAGRVNLFKRLLIVAIFILSPVSSTLAFIQTRLHIKKLRDDVRYFEGVDYEMNRI